MSFSSEVKEELCRKELGARHCNIAELAAIISFIGHIKISETGEIRLSITTESAVLARKYFTLLKKTYNIGTEVIISRNTFLNRKHTYTVSIQNDIDARKVLLGTKLLNADLEIDEVLSVQENLVIQSSCCKKAFLRGAFLASGSISDPEKSYHMEIICATMQKAGQIRDIMVGLRLGAKIVTRKKSYIVYLKESEQIVMALGLMEAGASLMDLENIRILKSMRGDVNRKVNCETANINKTVSAAVKQVEDIEYIRDTVGLETLTVNLLAVALARLENPDASLLELGESLSPRVGKSGINHRLRRLSEIADKLRGE